MSVLSASPTKHFPKRLTIRGNSPGIEYRIDDEIDYFQHVEIMREHSDSFYELAVQLKHIARHLDGNDSERRRHRCQQYQGQNKNKSTNLRLHQAVSSFFECHGRILILKMILKKKYRENRNKEN